MNGWTKIDEVDVRILKTLLKEPRTSFADIAKDCDMSTNAIRMRFKRLKKDGIIKGAIMQVNPKSLGYECIAHLGIQVDANKEANVLEFLHRTPSIIATHQQIGKYNIVSFLALKNVNELGHTVELVRNHPHVRNVDPCIWIDVIRIDHPENLVIEPFDGLLHTTDLSPENENPKPTRTPPHDASELAEETNCRCYELDKIDQLMLKILAENARMSFRKIAQKIGISTQTVIDRFKRLKKEVLPYSSITLDLEKIGYIGQAIFWIKVSHEYETSNVFKQISQIPNIIIACRCLGPVDIIVGAPFSNINHLIKLNQEIAKTPGVTQIDLLLHQLFYIWPLNMFSKLLPRIQNT